MSDHRLLDRPESATTGVGEVEDRNMWQTLFGVRTRNQSQVKNITAGDLYAQMSTGRSPLLVDVRSSQEYASDGHIEGARLLPLPVLAQRSAELPADRPIVCVCRSGNRSHVACEQLAALGFEDVTNLGGGMISWRRSGFPIE